MALTYDKSARIVAIIFADSVEFTYRVAILRCFLMATILIVQDKEKRLIERFIDADEFWLRSKN